MKHVIVATLILFTFQFAQAHGLRFEGSTGSNADIIFKGMLAASETDASIVVKKGYYGTSVFKEDVNAAIRCANQSATSFSCMVAMKHDRPLDPLEVYPLGKSIDPFGGADSNAALVAKIIQNLNGTDDNVEVLSLGSGSTVTRDTDDVSISCTVAVETKCHFQQ
jgi:hypothetical protein